MNIKISVIIPVYNIEKFLSNNIESLISQNFKEMEIIYINDGSKDNSLALLKKEAAKDKRVKIITQRNMGLSEARNAGLKIAKGKYVMFVDGDDFIFSDAIQVLVQKMEQQKLDILQGASEKADKYNSCRICDIGVDGDVLSGKKWLIKNDVCYTGCLYLYRREFLMNHNIFFVPNLLHEDMEYIPKAIYHAKRIMRTTCVFYGRVARQNSITRSRNMKRSLDLIKIAHLIECFCKNTETMEKTVYKQYFTEYINFLYVDSIHIGLIQGYDICDIIDSKKSRTDIVEHLIRSRYIRYRCLALFLKYRGDELYKLLYLIKMKIINRKIMIANEEGKRK